MAKTQSPQWRKEELWKRLLRIQRVIEITYGILTKPLQKFAAEIITHLPFSSFFFRPLFLNEIYMALGWWELFLRKNMLLNGGDVFIDIGAHIGYHTVHASKKVGKEGLVVAVEPDERNAKVLLQNIKATGANNILMYKVAVGLDGFLYLSPGENPLHTRTQRQSIREKHRVRSISLDSLIEGIGKLRNTKSDSFTVKIDIDRDESDIIRGGLSFLANSSPTLVVESWNPSKLEATLKPLGYSSDRYGNILTLRKEKHQT